jgi:hypothetical protein
MTSPAALSSIDSPHSRAHGHSRRPSTSWFHHRTENHLRPFSVIAVVMILILLRAETALAADPTDLFATVSGSLVTFRWQGDGALWVIEAGSAPGLADVGVTQFASTTRIRGFSNVPPGTYYVRVRAVVDGAAGPPSNEVVVVVGCSWGELDLRSTVLGLQVQLVWSAIGVIQGVQLEGTDGFDASGIGLTHSRNSVSSETKFRQSARRRPFLAWLMSDACSVLHAVTRRTRIRCRLCKSSAARTPDKTLACRLLSRTAA